MLAKLVKVTDLTVRHPAVEEAREEVQGMGNGVATKAEVALKFACSAVVDVVAQGWQLAVSKKAIKLRSPKSEGVSAGEVKQRIREGHLLERDAQLREPSVREFIKSMEQRRLGPAGWVSIFSLMRDGRELGRKLQAASVEQRSSGSSAESMFPTYCQTASSNAANSSRLPTRPSSVCYAMRNEQRAFTALTPKLRTTRATPMATPKWTGRSKLLRRFFARSAPRHSRCCLASELG